MSVLTARVGVVLPVNAGSRSFLLVSRSSSALTATADGYGTRFQSTDSTADGAAQGQHTLYQYKICPFSNIAKVYLNARGISFDKVEVNPLTKAELSFSKDAYKKVPILTVNDPQKMQLNGSEAIVHHFETQTAESESNSIDKNDNQQNEWEAYARNTLAPLLYPNLCESLSASYNAFNYVHSSSNNFTPLQRYLIQYVGSVAMYLAASKIKKKHGIDDARKALDDELLKLEQTLQQQDFFDVENSTTSLSPTELGLGDLSIFGVLKGLEGLPISTDILEDDRYTHLGQWYRKLDAAIGN